MKDKTYSLLIYLLLTLLILCLVSLAIIIESQEQVNKNELVKTPCRTVTVYDYNGQEIESWSGRFDVYQKKPSSVYFNTEEGKRVYINGGIIICEDN